METQEIAGASSPIPLWSSIREAIRGSHRDFTTGSLNRAILLLMGASPQIVAVGSGYARIALGGSGAILMLFLNNAIFRGAGDAAIAMRLLWVSNIINLILDPCLIFGLGPFPKLD